MLAIGSGRRSTGCTPVSWLVLLGLLAAVPAGADLADGERNGQINGLNYWDLFGTSVASAGDVNGDGYDDIIVGSELYGPRDGPEGGAFVWHGSANGITGHQARFADAPILCDKDFSRYGASVSGAGDVNGDGYDDVLIGSYSYTADDVREGAAWVHLGSANGVVGRGPATAHAQLEGNLVRGRFGQDVAGIGDIDGDGYDDIAVASLYEGIYLFRGSAAGIQSGGPELADGHLPGFGLDVAAAGDVNRDGYDDIIVVLSSRIFVFHGGAAGIPTGSTAAAELYVYGPYSYDRSNPAVGGGVDVNGDGYDDVVLGSATLDIGGTAWVYHGGPDGIGAVPNALLDGTQDRARFGGSVAGAGDVNGDGYGDLLVSARNWNDGNPVAEGAAFVYLGSETGIASGGTEVADFRLETDQPNSGFARPLAGAGDVNGDGYDDVLLGAPAYDTGNVRRGSAWLHHGVPTGGGAGLPPQVPAMGTPGVAAVGCALWLTGWIALRPRRGDSRSD